MEPRPGPIVLTDVDVRSGLRRELAIDAVRAGLAAPGGVQSPRQRAEAGDRRVVMAGAVDDENWLGIRARPAGVEDDIALVWDPSGRLVLVVIGKELGVRRTAAVGAVATDALARPDARVAGVIGSGRQAWGQLWGVAGVRSLDEVRVFSPSSEHVRAFVDEARRELEVDARPARSARSAAEGADIVILATNAGLPVVEAGWIGPGAHVTTIGPKSKRRHETPPELADAAEVFVVDQPEQVDALGEPFFSTRIPVSLASILDGSQRGRRGEEELTLFCSAGSPASDLVLLRLLASADRGTSSVAPMSSGHRGQAAGR